MVKAPIPKRLNRGAIKRAFPQVSEATWDNLFDNEKNNGLHELRVRGPDSFVYYEVEAVMEWLMERNLYRRADFMEPGELLYERSSLTIRRHLLAG